MAVRIAYQGVPGSFSSLASEAIFGPDIIPINTTRFRDIFDHVSEGRADAGVVPLENALAGTVQENYDLLAEFPCSIVAEWYCPVQLFLMSVPIPSGQARSLSDIRKAISHPKALEQCSRFFEANQNIEQVVYSDTAGAAVFVAEQADVSLAAIASEHAARLYGLEIIGSAIQNHRSNMTRFVALQSGMTTSEVDIAKPTAGRPNNKASLIFTLPHRPGSLHDLLGAIKANNLNVTKIESRPIAGSPFEYNFYLDLESATHTIQELLSVIEGFRPFASFLRVIGCYAAATRHDLD